MNKKLLAVATAAALAAPLASTSAVAGGNVTIYGKLHLQVVHADRNGQDLWTVADAQNSRLGFKGSEDLGNGLKAVWKLEHTYDVDAGAGLAGARNSYLGLSGEWGTIVAGRHDPAGKGSWYGVGLDFLDGSIIDLSEIGGQAAGNENQRSFFESFADDNRWSNVVHYTSPNFSGFSFAATIGAPEVGGNSDADGFDAWSVAVLYKGNGLKLGAGYTDAGDSGIGGDGTLSNGQDTSYWHISGSYTMNNITGGLTYSDQTNTVSGSGDARSIAGAVKVTFGNNYVVVNYTDVDFSGGASGGATDLGLAVGHVFSKRTQVYVAYTNVDASGGNDMDAFGLGMIHTF